MPWKTARPWARLLSPLFWTCCKFKRRPGATGCQCDRRWPKQATNHRISPNPIPLRTRKIPGKRSSLLRNSAPPTHQNLPVKKGVAYWWTWTASTAPILLIERWRICQTVARRMASSSLQPWPWAKTPTIRKIFSTPPRWNWWDRNRKSWAHSIPRASRYRPHTTIRSLTTL